VHFIGEEGIDAGGVKKEFFQLLVGELLSPDYGMLVYQPESNTYWWAAVGGRVIVNVRRRSFSTCSSSSSCYPLSHSINAIGPARFSTC
jgi:hypothetical protein